MDHAFNTLASTTYRISYASRGPFLPPIKYHQQPAIQQRGVCKLPPRKFPVSPPGPNRCWEKGTGQVLLPDIRPFTDKPIVREPPPQEIKVSSPPNKEHRPKNQQTSATDQAPADPLSDEPVVPLRVDGCQQIVEADLAENLCLSYRWKTTSKDAAEEGCLPVFKLHPPNSTMERRSDFLTYRPMRYNAHQLPWQRVAPLWDRLQERPRVGNDVTSREIGKPEATFKAEERSKSSKKVSVKKREDISLDDKIWQLVRDSKLSSIFVRNCPGYAGYVPRSPLNVAMEAQVNPSLSTMTTMKSSYRSFPAKEYTIKEFAHRGPLSRTVTLTYPYNPYNKVDSRAKEIENKW